MGDIPAHLFPERSLIVQQKKAEKLMKCQVLKLSPIIPSFLNNSFAVSNVNRP